MAPNMELTAQLRDHLDRIAHVPRLLVACDFDGTIAPIVSDPSAAKTDPDIAATLEALSRMPRTEVALISGRALHDLAAQACMGIQLHLVGSHGGEIEGEHVEPLDADAVRLIERIDCTLSAIAKQQAGFLIERKPAGVAFHYRNADEQAAAGAVQAILQGPARWPGVHVRHGKKVIELNVVHMDKGVALRRLRERLDATAVLFLGDDLTDEDAFEALEGGDVGIKVGPGETRARYRVADLTEVNRALRRVAECRNAWLAGSHIS